MKPMLAIARRDFAGMFLTPSGWVILSVWGCIASLIFVFSTLREGEPANLRAVVLMAGWMLAVLAPAISMRTFAEEARQNTLETLLSSPLTAGALVVGKFIACCMVLLTLAVPVLVLALVAEFYGRPDPGELASGLLGLLLLGMAMTSLGVLISTRTSSQVVAYLLTFFTWFAVVLIAKGLPAILPQILPANASIEWIDQMRGFDPLVRLDEFALGLFDSGNLMWFLALTSFFLLAAGVSIGASRRRRAFTARGRLGSALATLVFLIGGVAASWGVVSIFESPVLRIEADLTKTRAYSLSSATVELLEDLEPGWSIKLLVSDDTSDPVTVRLVDEVLERMTQATPSLTAERIDPVDPTSVGRYESLLESLLDREQDEITDWNTAIELGLEAFGGLRNLGVSMGPSAVDACRTIPADAPIRNAIERVGQTMGTIAAQGGAFEEYLWEALKSTADRPLPDWALVKASLVSNNELYAGQLEQLADLMRSWMIDESLPEAAIQWSAEFVDSVEKVTIQLRTSVQALQLLKPLQAARLGAAIALGDAAIVDGPKGTLVIPGWQLFPASAVREDGGAVIGFDRRFRGEETFAAAIRSLRLGSMPRVVFVHPEATTMLRPRDDGMDVSAVAEAMKTARMDVEEWMPGQTVRPGPLVDRPTVWVVMPPLRRKGLEYDDNEKALLDATKSLLAEGEPVLLTTARSMLPMVGQDDPWQSILEDFGVRVDTGDVIFEWLPAASSEGDSGVITYQEIDAYPSESGVVGGALRGKRLFLNHPTPIRVDDSQRNDFTVIAEVSPSVLRFVESDWRGDGERITRLPEEKRFDSSQPVVVSMERDGNRVIVVGSGGWLLSGLVNDSGTLGGDRVILSNPGNRELALSGVSWLAGMDELVATASTGREVTRFSGVTPGTRLLWGVLLPTLLGIGPLVFGGIVWAARRRVA